MHALFINPSNENFRKLPKDFQNVRVGAGAQAEAEGTRQGHSEHSHVNKRAVAFTIQTLGLGEF